jgi:hypothetical protein
MSFLRTACPTICTCQAARWFPLRDLPTNFILDLSTVARAALLIARDGIGKSASARALHRPT